LRAKAATAFSTS